MTPLYFPPEILNLIFSYLTFDECKFLRRVCKLWNDCISPKRIKFVFRGDCSIPQIVQILMNPHHTQIDLEFHLLVVDCLPACVWEICGPRIYSLDLYNCCLDEITFKFIILRCTNLRILRLRNEDYDWPNDTLQMLSSLNYFIEKGIVRTQLHTFALTMTHNRTISGAEFILILSTFPSIKYFNCPLDEQLELPNELLHSNVSSIQLRSISTFPLYQEQILRSPALHQCRLTKFGACFDCVPCSDSLKETIFHFFSIQKDLEIIDLKKFDCFPFVKQLIFHILENCFKLRIFSIKSHFACELSSIELTRFIQLISSLQSLSLDCNFWIDEPLPEPLSTKLSLEILTLGYSVMENGEELVYYIFQHCSNLKHLKLHNDSDEVLQLVFELLPKLKILNLRKWFSTNVTQETNYGFKGRNGVSIKTLTELVELRIRYYDRYHCHLNVVKEVTHPFPELKYLDIWLEDIDVRFPEKEPGLKFEDIYLLASKLPKLETFKVKPYRPKNIDEIVKLIKELKNLKYFGVSNVESLKTKSDTKPLFEGNLKFFSTISKIFWFNSFSGKIYSIRNCGLNENEILLF